MYKCDEVNCEEKFDDADEFQVHTSYHRYYQKIKDICKLELESLEKKLHTQIDCPLANTVEACFNFPQLPTRLICEWHNCGQTFLCVSTYYEHVASHAHRLVDRCYWADCHREMKKITPFLMREHLRIHTVQKLFACPQCGHLFSTKIKFEDHFLRHMQLPSFILNSKDNPEVRLEHVKSQGRGDKQISIETYSFRGDKIKVFVCTQDNCNKAFLSSSLINEHNRSHSCKYQCDQCPFIATTLSRLQSHKLFRHEDLRNFECSICSKSFKQIGDLRAHVKRHQIMSYKCDKCEFEAHNEEGLNKHLKIHDKANAYICHICNRIFSRGNNLSRHFITQHDLSLPDGQSKFKYRLVGNGLYVLDLGDNYKFIVTETRSEESPTSDRTNLNDEIFIEDGEELDNIKINVVDDFNQRIIGQTHS